MFSPSGHNEIQIRRNLMAIGLTVLTVLLGYYAIKTGQPIFGLLLPLVALGSFLLGKPALLFTALLFVENARLKIPGLPGALGVPEVLQLVLIGWVILDASIRKTKRPFSSDMRLDGWIFIFMLNIMFIMFARGVGFRILGGGEYGGAGYIMLLISLVFYFAACRISLNNREVKILLWAVLISSLIPMAAAILIARFPSQLWFLTNFIQTNVAAVLSQQEREGGIERWASFSSVAYALIPIAYVLVKKPKVRFFLIVLAFALVAMTGFRSRIGRVGILVFMTSLYYAKDRAAAFFRWGLIGILIWVFLIIAAPVLPRAIQRTVSFVPFVQVAEEISRRAEGSSDWRFQMWKEYCIPNVPKYLLIGRGAVSDIKGFAWLKSSWYGTAEFYYHMHGYHSGPFSLILDYGLLGTLSFTMFFLLVTGDAWKTVRRYAARREDLASRYYVFLAIVMTFEVFNFYFIFGTVMSSLFRMLVLAIQLRILKKNFLMEPTTAGAVTGLEGETVQRLNGESKLNTSLKPVNRWASHRPGARG